MNILFIHKSLVIGGAERILINYLNILADVNNLHITLLLLENKGKENKNIKQINKNIKIKFALNREDSRKYLELESKVKQKSFFRKIYKFLLKILNKKLKREIKNNIEHNEIDLIINFNSHLDFFLYENTTKKPIIRWIHGQAHLDDWRKHKDWYKNILPQHHSFFAITKEMKKNAKNILQSYGIKEEQINMLYNPIDIEFIKKQSTKQENSILDKNYLINVSRLDKEKNHKQLINIYYELKKHGIKQKLYIVGDGDYRSILEKQIKALHLEKDCILLGNKDNPYPLMKNATLFLYTSLKEGLPTVLIESMICGTPTIAMDCPTGPKEILQNGKFGGLVKLGNEKAFIEKTLLLLNSPEEYNKYLKTLNEAIAPFHFDKIKNELLEYLNKLDNKNI